MRYILDRAERIFERRGRAQVQIGEGLADLVRGFAAFYQFFAKTADGFKPGINVRLYASTRSLKSTWD